MDRGAWSAAVHGVAKSRTRLSDWTELIVALQRCVSFLLYSKVNQSYVYIYPLFFGFPSHLGYYRTPSRVPCATQKVLITVICFTHGSVYMSIPASWFIPPPFLLLVTISLFSTSVSLLLPCIISTVFLDSTCKWYYMIYFFLFLTSFTLYDNL